jgi:hypothetical protein
LSRPSRSSAPTSRLPAPPFSLLGYLTWLRWSCRICLAEYLWGGCQR